MNTKELLKDFEKNFPLIDPDLDLNPSYESLEKEFFWYLDHKGKLSTYCANNAIIKAFQQDMFYIHERSLVVVLLSILFLFGCSINKMN